MSPSPSGAEPLPDRKTGPELVAALGVGPLEVGDRVTAGIEDVGRLELRITSP